MLDEIAIVGDDLYGHQGGKNEEDNLLVGSDSKNAIIDQLMWLLFHSFLLKIELILLFFKFHTKFYIGDD